MAVITVKWDHINMVMHQKFCQYLCEGNFYDCTLSCEEKIIPAHRIVLSAASKYFEERFMMYAERQMIVLQEVAYDDLVAVVKFIYTGEAKILTENCERFMRTAKILQIKGLGHGGPTLHQDKPPKSSQIAGNLYTTWPNTPTGTAGAPAKTKQTRKQICQNMTALPPHHSKAKETFAMKLEATSLSKAEIDYSGSDTEFNSDNSEDEKRLKAKTVTSKKIDKKPSTPKGTARCRFCLKVCHLMMVKRHSDDCKANPDRIILQRPICQKRFFRNDYLKYHVATHSKKTNDVPK